MWQSGMKNFQSHQVKQGVNLLWKAFSKSPQGKRCPSLVLLTAFSWISCICHRFLALLLSHVSQVPAAGWEPNGTTMLLWEQILIHVVHCSLLKIYLKLKYQHNANYVLQSVQWKYKKYAQYVLRSVQWKYQPLITHWFHAPLPPWLGSKRIGNMNLHIHSNGQTLGSARVRNWPEIIILVSHGHGLEVNYRVGHGFGLENVFAIVLSITPCLAIYSHILHWRATASWI